MFTTSRRRVSDVFLIITVIDERAHVVVIIGRAIAIIAIVGCWFRRWLITRWIVDIYCLCISPSEISSSKMSSVSETGDCTAENADEDEAAPRHSLAQLREAEGRHAMSTGLVAVGTWSNVG